MGIGKTEKAMVTEQKLGEMVESILENLKMMNLMAKELFCTAMVRNMSENGKKENDMAKEL